MSASVYAKKQPFSLGLLFFLLLVECECAQNEPEYDDDADGSAVQPEHSAIFFEDLDCPFAERYGAAEYGAAQSDGAQFVGCSAGEAVVGDDDAVVVRFDGAGCVGECGEFGMAGVVFGG